MLNEIDQATMKELLAGENGKLIQGYSDSRVSQAVKTTLEKNPSALNAGKRLQVIQEAADKRIKQLELDKIVLRKCYESGLDYSIIEKLGLSFENEESIDEKLDTLKASMEKQNVGNINSLLSNGYKPQTAMGEESRPFGIPKDVWSKLSMAEKAIIESK